MNVQAITLNIVDNLSRQSLTKSDTSMKLPLDQTTSSALSTTAIVNKMTDLLTAKTGQILNDEDKTKINALDWIVYDPSQRLKLLEYANLTMRYFLLERQNLEATKNIFQKIPQDTLTSILNQYNYNNSHIGQVSTNAENNLQQIIDNLPNSVSNSIKEYLCFKEYIVRTFFVINTYVRFKKSQRPFMILSVLTLNYVILRKILSNFVKLPNYWFSFRHCNVHMVFDKNQNIFSKLAF